MDRETDDRTTVATLMYRHPDSDDRIEYVRTVRLDQLHKILAAIDAADEPD